MIKACFLSIAATQKEGKKEVVFCFFFQSWKTKIPLRRNRFKFIKAGLQLSLHFCKAWTNFILTWLKILPGRSSDVSNESVQIQIFSAQLSNHKKGWLQITIRENWIKSKNFFKTLKITPPPSQSKRKCLYSKVSKRFLYLCVYEIVVMREINRPMKGDLRV